MTNGPSHTFLWALLALCACKAETSAAVPTPKADGWWRGKSAYEVFVRSFADGNGNGVGDLKGLTAHLDYLNDGDPATTSDLGVDAIWLMPIFPSPSYHGYDVTDYRGVNPEYGTLADFDAFAQAAHQRGIQVILDLVLNHSSNQHPWFVDSRQSTTAAHRDWYVWSQTDLHWPRPWDNQDPWHPAPTGYFYGLFCDCMPDLNLANPAVEQELTDAMKFWIGHGVDGFRLDAVRHYFESSAGGAAGEVDQPATYAFLRRLRASMDAVRPGTLLIGEAWTSATTVATYYGAGDGLQLAFSFDLADAIKQGLASGDAAPVINALAVAEQVFPDRGFEAPFLSNHDQARVLRSLGGNHAAMRAAAATLFALPGTPFVYYGEEIGMQGGSSSDDKDKRTAMRWNATAPGFGFGSNQPQIQRSEDPGTDVATQQADPASLWTLYRKLIALRHARAGLASAAAIRPAITGGGTGLVALQRGAPGERMLFVANYSASTSSPFSLSVSGTGTVLLSEGLASPPTPASGQLSFGGLGPYSFAFLSL